MRCPSCFIPGLIPGAVLAWILLLSSPLHGQPVAEPAPYHIPRERIESAMAMETGYDVTVTPNGVRFQSNVILRLVRWGREEGWGDHRLFIDHEDYFRAYLAATGLAEDEAPEFARISYRHGQDLLIEPRPERVVREVVAGPPPEMALNITYWWPPAPDAPSYYSYHDTLSSPHLRVTHRQTVTYRLLSFGDMIVHDEIEGIYGRATSGVLGLLFRVLGDGQALHSRMTVADDGTQVVYARARKGPFRKNQTVIVFPDGKGEKNIPDDRPDLQALAERLLRPLEIDYVAWSQDLSGL